MSLWLEDWGGEMEWIYCGGVYKVIDLGYVGEEERNVKVLFKDFSCKDW